MLHPYKKINLVLSGGGVKGIAYAGAFAAAEERDYRWGNIAGVSAGALVGSLSSSGYNAKEMWEILDRFDFEKIKMEEIPKKVPVVSSYINYSSTSSTYIKSYEHFLEQNTDKGRGLNFSTPAAGYRGNLLKNIIAYSKDGCLYDGDYLEEWISKALLKKGVRSFGDLRGGLADKVNPKGYKIRMTAVDANRGRIIVIPDDLTFYNLDPDKFEVAKAVRMSTSVPFAFKPVELKKKVDDVLSTFYIIDGGVFDNFPCWLISNSYDMPSIGLRLDGGEKKKLLSVDTPLAIIKGLISAVHDIGLPKHKFNCSLVSVIDASKVPYLDFNLTQEEKEYLFKAGESSSIKLFAKFEEKFIHENKGLLSLLPRKFRCIHSNWNMHKK